MTETKPEQWNKRDRIVYLLDHWQDIFSSTVTSTWATFTGTSHQGSASKEPGYLPRIASDRSVKKVELALSTLSDREPVLARHLKAFRCNCEWRTTDHWVARRLPSGKPEFVEERIREKIVPRWVDPRKVTLAETILVNFVHGDVSIPTVLYHALTKDKGIVCECRECRRS